MYFCTTSISIYIHNMTYFHPLLIFSYIFIAPKCTILNLHTDLLTFKSASFAFFEPLHYIMYLCATLCISKKSCVLPLYPCALVDPERSSVCGITSSRINITHVCIHGVNQLLTSSQKVLLTYV